MKQAYLYILLLVALFSCTSQENSAAFIEETSGRYLFNTNEVIEIFFEEGIMFAKWRGKDRIELLKVNDSSFYMKDLNEKMVFVSRPEMHIELAEKSEHKGVKYSFRKLQKGEKTPTEYFNNKEFDKALVAFKAIQAKDSLDVNINERRINSLGYQFIRNGEINSAIEMFKINVALYPKSSNVYDSLGDAYLKSKDTLNAEKNYKKALSINPENRNAKRNLERLRKS